jgi:hypothetical protein
MKIHDSSTSSDFALETSESPSPIDLRDPWSIEGFLVDRDGDQAADDAALVDEIRAAGYLCEDTSRGTVLRPC